MRQACLAALALAGLALPAHAHTPLASSVPAAGSTVAPPVKEIVLVFGGDVRLTALARIAAVAALCLAVLHYVLTPARMAGYLGSTFDPSLSQLLLESNAGSAHIVRILGLAVFFLSLDRRNRLNTIAMRAALGLTIL